MYAVVETGGKQYKVKEGLYVDIDLLDAKPESKVNLDKVVAIIAGEHSKIGQPYVEGASIQGKILKHDKAKKVITFKMRQKKGYRLKKGHRQDFTRVLIENIECPDKEELLKHSKTLEDQLEKERLEQEAKLEEIKTKRRAKKDEAKAEKVKQTKKTKKAEDKKEPPAKKAEKPVEEIDKTDEVNVEEVVEQTVVTEAELAETETTENSSEETKE